MSLKNMNLGNSRCCNIVSGAVGPQGATGAQGSYGPIGEIGITGSTGSTGYIGSTGICYRGYKGTQGYKGAQGGITGNTGSPGPQGESGSLSSSQNVYFTFTINNGESYNSTGFTELTSLASIPIENTIRLTKRNYVVSFEINENWTDTTSNMYFTLDNGTNQYSYVFNPNNLSYLVLNTNGTNLYGIGNDAVFTLPIDTYTIKIFQTTTSSLPIQIGGKNVKFSITFVNIS
jgi:hypothetical protein